MVTNTITPLLEARCIEFREFIRRAAQLLYFIVYANFNQHH
jgi:hypothetical protein